FFPLAVAAKPPQRAGKKGCWRVCDPPNLPLIGRARKSCDISPTATKILGGPGTRWVPLRASCCGIIPASSWRDKKSEKGYTVATQQWSMPPEMQIDPAKNYRATIETNR